MPANSNLQWFDIDDFTAGMWEEQGYRAEFASPPNAFRTLTDYWPQPGGGIRAFFKAEAVGVSGLDDATDEEPSGIYASQITTRPGKTGGGTESFDALLTTVDRSDFKARIYRMDQGNDATTWTKLHTTTAAATLPWRITCFDRFQEAADDKWYVLTLQSGLDGLYTVGYEGGASGTGIDGDVAKIEDYSGVLVVSQNRLIVGDGRNSKLWYSDVGDLNNFGSTSFVNIHRARNDAVISGISGIAPDDLLIAKEGAPWVSVNGDLASPSTPIREMGMEYTTHRHRQMLRRVPGGVAFITTNGRVTVTDGRNFQPISNQIKRFTGNEPGAMLGVGSMAYNNGFLFLPKNYVYDFETKAWFQHSAVTDSTFHHANDFDIWCCGGGVNADIKRMGLHRPASSNRVSTGVIETVPYADKTGRTIEIREIQLFVNCYAASEFKVELIDQGGNSVVTRYAVVASAIRDRISFLFPNTQSEYLSVKVTPRAIDASSEAPTIERMRIGFGGGTNLTNA